METYIRITEDTLHWFLPLLPQAERDALQNDKRVYAVGAVCDKAACGVLVFRIDDGVADICYLAVSGDRRRQGVATGMVNYLCSHAYEPVMPVTCTFCAGGLSDEVYLFFASLDNFSVGMEQGYSCSIPLGEMAHTPLASMGAGKKRQYQAFFSLPAAEQKRFFRKLNDKNIYFLRGIREEQYRKPLCLCAMAGADVKAAVFVTERAGEELELSLAWCDTGGGAGLIGLLAEACEMLPEDGTGSLHIAAVNPESASLIDRLLPRRVVTGRFYQAVWDMEL